MVKGVKSYNMVILINFIQGKKNFKLYFGKTFQIPSHHSI